MGRRRRIFFFVVAAIAQKYADIVVKGFNPKQILLFGSYLYGTPEENSDVDIVVVFDKGSEPENWWKASSRLQRICRMFDAIDVEPHLLEWDAPPHSFTRHVQSVVYQR